LARSTLVADPWDNDMFEFRGPRTTGPTRAPCGRPTGDHADDSHGIPRRHPNRPTPGRTDASHPTGRRRFQRIRWHPLRNNQGHHHISNCPQQRKRNEGGRRRQMSPSSKRHKTNPQRSFHHFARCCCSRVTPPSPLPNERTALVKTARSVSNHPRHCASAATRKFPSPKGRL